MVKQLENSGVPLINVFDRFFQTDAISPEFWCNCSTSL